MVLSSGRENEYGPTSIDFENGSKQIPTSRIADRVLGENATYRIRPNEVVDLLVSPDDLDNGTVDEFQFHLLVVRWRLQ